MTKRAFNKFERNPRDYYPTPEGAVLPLLPFLNPGRTILEPCAGDGRLASHLEKHLKDVFIYMSDIEPQYEDIEKIDMFDWTPFQLKSWDCVITNPPWQRDILHRMIEHFAPNVPTWLLFDADWFYTKQAQKYKPYLYKIVSVGRVKWIEDSKSVGFDNCAWYLFDSRNNHKHTFAQAY